MLWVGRLDQMVIVVALDLLGHDVLNGQVGVQRTGWIDWRCQRQTKKEN